MVSVAILRILHKTTFPYIAKLAQQHQAFIQSTYFWRLEISSRRSDRGFFQGMVRSCFSCITISDDFHYKITCSVLFFKITLRDYTFMISKKQDFHYFYHLKKEYPQSVINIFLIRNFHECTVLKHLKDIDDRGRLNLQQRSAYQNIKTFFDLFYLTSLLFAAIINVWFLMPCSSALDYFQILVVCYIYTVVSSFYILCTLSQL